MHYLRKILLIAVIGTLVGNYEEIFAIMRSINKRDLYRSRGYDYSDIEKHAQKKSRLTSDEDSSKTSRPSDSGLKKSKQKAKKSTPHNLSHAEVAYSDDSTVISSPQYSLDDISEKDQDSMLDDSSTELVPHDPLYIPETPLLFSDSEISATTSPSYIDDSMSAPDFSSAIDISTESQIFDLPEDIPGTQTKIDKIVDGILTPCIQVSISESEDWNIIFPEDAHQPTISEAIEYSCADVDKREDSPITDWYIRMFGILPYKGTKRIKAGYGKKESAPYDIRPREIIEFQKECTCELRNRKQEVSSKIKGCGAIDTQHPCTYSLNGHRLGFCKEMFRKIASTPVGRVLLYRILIEIRRHHKGSKIGCLDTNVVSESKKESTDPKTSELMEQRENSRYLVIAWDSEGEFIPDEACICTSDKKPMGTVIGKSSKKGTHIYKCAIPADVALFHELVHWFLFLRNPVRVDQEARDENQNNWPLPCWNLTLEMTPKQLEVTRSKWGTKDGEGNSHFSFEEIRTILGMSPKFQPYYNGDDISENLYRTCVRLPLRYGHYDEGFYEDNRIIEKVLQTTYENSQPYSTKKIGSNYGSSKNRQDIGNGKVQPVSRRTRAGSEKM